MSKIVFTSGMYIPYHAAVTHVEDRGYQFGDGVYEVIAIIDGHLIDCDWHLERLQRSCDEIRLDNPYNVKVWKTIINEVMRRNKVKTGTVYLQITRGTSARNFIFPDNIKPNVVVLSKSQNHLKALKDNASGVKVITSPELRWRRPDIKSICLLPSVLKKQEAKEHNAFEVIWINEENNVLEGGASNLWWVDENNILVTHPNDNRILSGITRRRLLDVAKKNDYLFEERTYKLDELLSAREVFLTSSSIFVVPVVQVDNQQISNGKPGKLVKYLRQEYIDFVSEFSN